jgi:acyl-CoA dehydrogenase family protein 9
LNGLQNPSEQLKELRSALREPMKNFGLLSEYAATRVKNVFGATATLDVELHPRLEEHKEYLEKHVAELAAGTQRAIIKHKQEIIHRQLVVERLANMAIELFATTCVLSRTQSLVAQRGLDACQGELALCDLFCVESGRRFREARQALDDREDAVDDTRRAAAAAIRSAGGYFPSDTILKDDGAK